MIVPRSSATRPAVARDAVRGDLDAFQRLTAQPLDGMAPQLSHPHRGTLRSIVGTGVAADAIGRGRSSASEAPVVPPIQHATGAAMRSEECAATA